MYCANCNHIYSPEEFEKIIPPHSNIGYDVMVLIGRLIFCKHHTLMETVLELEKISKIYYLPINTASASRRNA